MQLNWRILYMGCNRYTGFKPRTLWISMIVTDTASYGQVSFLTWTQVRKLRWWARLTQIATSIWSPGWPPPPFKLSFRGTCSYWPILNDGLVPIGRHAIIWTNDGLIFWDCFLINKYLLRYGQIYIKTAWVDRMDWHRAEDKTLSEPITV